MSADRTSPRPWRADPDLYGEITTADASQFVAEAQEFEDAALIVRAVNAHGALVALAERVAESFDENLPLGESARAALKLARGEA